MLIPRSPLTVGAALVVWSIASALTGCSDNKTTTAPKTPVAASIVNMSNPSLLIAPVATTIQGGASVQVLDANGAPVSGATVTWTAYDGSAVSSATSTTNSQGMAVVDWTFGTIAEADSLQASVNSSISTTIVGTALAGPVAQLVKVEGDQAVLGEGASTTLEVEAEDQYGNAVANTTVTWLDQSGGALSAATTVTDASGMAAVMFTADAAPEQYQIVAQDATASVTFVDSSN